MPVGNDEKLLNFLIVGVGGQGVVLASEILAEVVFASGLEVKKSEVHGMAQRGGSVVSHLRCGTRVFSPLVSEGEVDFLISFEKLETLRYLHFLKTSSTVLVNNQEIYPLTVSSGRASYPQVLKKTLKTLGVKFKIIEGQSLAARAGNIRAVNAVVLGALARLLPFETGLWEQALKAKVPGRFYDSNLEAFRLGRKRRMGPSQRAKRTGKG